MCHMLRNLWMEGSVTFLKNGDIWEGELQDLRWFKTNKYGEEKHCSFVLDGSVTIGGVKEEGRFLCEDDGTKWCLVKKL